MIHDVGFTDNEFLDLVEGIRVTEGVSWAMAEEMAVGLIMNGLEVTKKGLPKNPHLWNYVWTILVAHARMTGRFREVN